MLSRIHLSALLFAAISLPTAMFRAGEKASADRPCPSIAFSDDQRTVTVEHKGKKWILPRPVITPWVFKRVGEVFWVSPDGDDTDRGGETTPFRTFARALARVRPGDIIYARPGTYREYLQVRRSGTDDEPIILSCAPGALGKVKLAPPLRGDEKHRLLSGITLVNVSHVWLNGFVIEGARGLPAAAKANEIMTGTNGVSWAGTSGIGCRVSNCVVYWHVHCGLKGTDIGGKGIRLESNVVFDNGSTSRDHGIYMQADDIIADGNVVFDNAGFGIHSYSNPKHQTISRNVCFGNPLGGIIIAGSDCNVFHNTSVFNGRGVFYYAGTCTRNRVQNNIFAFNKENAAFGDGGPKLGAPSDNLDDYNCYFPEPPPARLPPGSHEILSDPRFRGTGKGDYRLRDTSPCLRKGVKLDTPGALDKPSLGAYR